MVSEDRGKKNFRTKVFYNSFIFIGSFLLTILYLYVGITKIFFFIYLPLLIYLSILGLSVSFVFYLFTFSRLRINSYWSSSPNVSSVVYLDNTLSLTLGSVFVDYPPHYCIGSLIYENAYSFVQILKLLAIVMFILFSSPYCGNPCGSRHNFDNRFYSYQY